MTIECKDLEWREYKTDHFATQGCEWDYAVWQNHATGKWEVHVSLADWEGTDKECERDTREQAQAAANEHNKQQFQAIIEEWRKG